MIIHCTPLEDVSQSGPIPRCLRSPSASVDPFLYDGVVTPAPFGGIFLSLEHPSV